MTAFHITSLLEKMYAGGVFAIDGTEKLLQSIIGKTVNKLSTKEAIDGGFICPHDYKIVSIESSNPNYNSQLQDFVNTAIERTNVIYESPDENGLIRTAIIDHSSWAY